MIMNKYFSLCLTIIALVLGNTLFAQNKSIVVNGQRLQLHSDNQLDGMNRDSLCVAININGFYGPYITEDEGGRSKEYWFNGTYTDCYPASSVWIYSGECLYDEDFSRFDVTSTESTYQKGRIIMRGCEKGLYFREDFYCDRRLVIAYFFVRQRDVSRFDQILDDALQLPYPHEIIDVKH